MSFRIARAKAVCGQQDSDVLSRGPGPKPHLHGREGGRPFNRKIYIYCVYICYICIYTHGIHSSRGWKRHVLDWMFSQFIAPPRAIVPNSVPLHPANEFVPGRCLLGVKSYSGLSERSSP